MFEDVIYSDLIRKFDEEKECDGCRARTYPGECEECVQRDKYQTAISELSKLTNFLLSTNRYDHKYGSPVEQAIRKIVITETELDIERERNWQELLPAMVMEREIDKLANYLLKNFEINEGSAVDNAIRLLKLYSNRCED